MNSMTLSTDGPALDAQTRTSVVDLVYHTDRELLRKISAELDCAAMETFYRQFQPRLLPILKRLIYDPGRVD